MATILTIFVFLLALGLLMSFALVVITILGSLGLIVKGGKAVGRKLDACGAPKLYVVVEEKAKED